MADAIPSLYDWDVLLRNRRHIPEAVKKQWVEMSTHMRSSEIARVTGASQRTVDLHLLRLTGSVVKKPLEGGRPRSLTAHDVRRTSDIYLCELQYHLRESRGIEVSVPTIQRTPQLHISQ
ncbi:hypothetical protein V8B97DRAFT_2024660 [Scleroderma yunnanense]